MRALLFNSSVEKKERYSPPSQCGWFTIRLDCRAHAVAMTVLCAFVWCARSRTEYNFLLMRIR